MTIHTATQSKTVTKEFTAKTTEETHSNDCIFCSVPHRYPPVRWGEANILSMCVVDFYIHDLDLCLDQCLDQCFEEI